MEDTIIFVDDGFISDLISTNRRYLEDIQYRIRKMELKDELKNELKQHEGR
ncbi:MAG: hypothetical protein AABX48_02935 [Nanoarchaeota archaeon]